MARKSNAKRKQREAIEGPTPEQAGRAEYRRAGLSYRKVPVIDTMRDRGQLTDSEHRALTHYRDQAHLAERSPIKSCLDQRVGGGDIELPAAIVSAMLATGRIERDLGSLLQIARSVAVDDISLTQWCVDRHGGRERYDRRGRFVAIVPVGERKVMELALLDLRMAARRIAPIAA